MYVRVIVAPGSRKEEVEELKSGQWRISVKEEAERNLANARVREIVARLYKKPLSAVRLTHGHHSRSKIFSVEDLRN